MRRLAPLVLLALAACGTAPRPDPTAPTTVRTTRTTVARPTPPPPPPPAPTASATTPTPMPPPTPAPASPLESTAAGTLPDCGTPPWVHGHCTVPADVVADRTLPDGWPTEPRTYYCRLFEAPIGLPDAGWYPFPPEQPTVAIDACPAAP